MILIIVACKKEDICIVDCDPTEQNSLYYIDETIELSLNENIYIVDTTQLILVNDSLVHPKFQLVNLSLVSDTRCGVNVCLVCIGGFADIDIEIKNIYTEQTYRDTLSYASCGSSNTFGRYIFLENFDYRFHMLRVTPQPGDEPHHYDCQCIPEEEYMVSLMLKLNQ